MSYEAMLPEQIMFMKLDGGFDGSHHAHRACFGYAVVRPRTRCH
jgi:hypothetical protein